MRAHQPNSNTIKDLKRRKFTEEEDVLLARLVKEMGPKNWDQIAKMMNNRNAKQCRDRYRNYLMPGFFNGEWTDEEDYLLYQKYLEIGPRWAIIANSFANRSPNVIKNRWIYYVSKLDLRGLQQSVIYKNIKNNCSEDFISIKKEDQKQDGKGETSDSSSDESGSMIYQKMDDEELADENDEMFFSFDENLSIDAYDSFFFTMNKS